MTVRAKMVCKLNEGDSHVKLEAVVTGSAENDAFFKYTPAAYLDMWATREAIAGNFEVGKEYYIDITPAN